MASVNAEIKLILRIRANSRWGEGSTIGQVQNQALDSVLSKLSNALGKSRYDIECISQPECLRLIITEPILKDLPEPEKSFKDKFISFFMRYSRFGFLYKGK